MVCPVPTRTSTKCPKCYHLGLIARIRHISAPFIAPFIFAALRNAHALAWKVIVVAEIFGTARAGFGPKFKHGVDYMIMIDVHLWLLVFMAIVLFRGIRADPDC